MGLRMTILRGMRMVGDWMAVFGVRLGEEALYPDIWKICCTFA
jgi:hypothetical protein